MYVWRHWRMITPPPRFARGVPLLRTKKELQHNCCVTARGWLLGCWSSYILLRRRQCDRASERASHCTCVVRRYSAGGRWINWRSSTTTRHGSELSQRLRCRLAVGQCSTHTEVTLDTCHVWLI